MWYLENNKNNTSKYRAILAFQQKFTKIRFPTKLRRVIYGKCILKHILMSLTDFQHPIEISRPVEISTPHESRVIQIFQGLKNSNFQNGLKFDLNKFRC